MTKETGSPQERTPMKPKKKIDWKVIKNELVWALTCVENTGNIYRTKQKVKSKIGRTCANKIANGMVAMLKVYLEMDKQ